MAFPDRFRNIIASSVRDRGKAYYLENRVALKQTWGDIVSAEVRGSRMYEVVLRLEDDDLLVSCTCPFFLDSFDCCKHIWAGMLKASSFHLFERNQPSALIPVEPSPVTDRSGGIADQPEVVRNTIPPWRSAIRSLSWLPAAATKPLIPSLRIFYVLDLDLTLKSGLTIRVLSHSELKKGGRSKPRDFTIALSRLRELQDPADREILGLLPSPPRRVYSYYGYEREPEAKSPALSEVSEMADFFLPRIAQTGRLFLSRDRDQTLQGPLRWDHDEEAWQFHLRVVPHENTYRIEGNYQRGENEIALSEPVLLMPEFLVHQDVISRAQNGAAWQWVPLLRRSRDGVIEIPVSDRDALIDELVSSPFTPAIELPQELQWEEVRLAPKPHIFLKTDGTGSRLRVDLSFDYEQLRIPFEKPGERMRDGNRIVVRDLAAEAEARDRLEALSSRPDYYGNRTVAVNRTLALVRELVREGWIVEGEHGLFRPHTSLSARIASGVDWFELEGGASFGDEEVPLPLLLAAIQKRERFIRLGDGSLGLLPEEWIETLSPLLNAGSQVDGTIRFRSSQAMLLDAMLATREEISFDKQFANVRQRFRAAATLGPLSAPPQFQGTLRPYQELGLSWLAYLREIECGGCLADDMGLGKTVQVLAALLSIHTPDNKAKQLPSLVVMPRSLIFNWKAEASRFAPGLRLLDQSGSARQKDGGSFKDYDVVITTYGTVRRDIEHLASVEFEYVILDEAQAIKNASSQSAKAVRLLKARHRLALSGTPIENHLGELWSLFEFLNPGMFGTSSAFNARGFANEAAGSEVRALLAHALRPFILRRTKEQVAPELPPKMEQTLYCELEKKERAQYDELRKYYQTSLLGKIKESGINKSKMHVLEALLRLRQAACHPGLIHRDQIGAGSAKLDTLLAELDTVLGSGHKALVFSQFTSFLAIVRRDLDQRGIAYCYLDGKSKDRQEQVEHFQSDEGPGLFLISLKAGGLGLNLTAADYVFLLDPWWNPAVEAQAVDRAHRIGQSRNVFAFRLVARDTVEEKILELQKSKRALADSIINADNSVLRNLDLKDLEMLLGV